MQGGEKPLCPPRRTAAPNNVRCKLKTTFLPEDQVVQECGCTILQGVKPYHIDVLAVELKLVHAPLFFGAKIRKHAYHQKPVGIHDTREF